LKILNSVYTKEDLKLCIQKHKGQLTIFAFLLFGMIVALYLGGYKSPFLEFVTNDLVNMEDPSQVFNAFMDQLANIFSNPTSFAIVGLLLAGVIISTIITGGGSGTLFIISLFVIMIFANIFIMPISFIFEEASWGNAEVLKLLLVVFLNLLMIMSIISFTRSGET